MDDTVGFSASNRSTPNPPQSSDDRLVMLYKGVKIQPSLGGNFTHGIWMFWLVVQQQEVLLKIGDRRSIWRIEKVQKYPPNKF